MAKYRIKIEAMDPAEELRAEYRMGIECNGFCIIGDCDDGHSISIHQMSDVQIADIMAKDENLITVACIARGMAEGSQYEENIKRRDAMKKLAKRIGAMEDDDE